MTRATQPALFGAEPQTDAFETNDAPPPAYKPDLADVRLRLNAILAQARAAESLPWDADKALLYRTIFPHMAGWLPKKEGEQLCFEFETQMARLKAA
jgi:hypothetical protein